MTHIPVARLMMVLGGTAVALLTVINLAFTLAPGAMHRVVEVLAA